MAQNSFFSHTRGSSTPCTRTEERGFPRWQGCGENIAAGYPTAEDTMTQWKESNGHCLNMMDTSFNRFGAGLADVSGSAWTYYWTQAFGIDTVVDTGCIPQSASTSTALTLPSSSTSTVPVSECIDDP